MSRVAIRGVGLGKRYAIGERERYLALRDVIARVIRAPLELFRLRPTNYVWALKDITIDVEQGEVVGIVGRNGSGKSTLLKILSRVTRPTEGWAEIHGHVGSLLEVGTGFHPELTGRENIYLNAAILGMKKRQIDQKFDEIVSFAEVERFLDTAVKHYSSGMHMRLAFAVAAHLEPEILFVDEVLAVGDTGFQKKCLGKLGEVAGQGRTVLFVSHQMNQIRRICNRCLWLDSGRIRMEGPAERVINAYEESLLTFSPTRDGGLLQPTRFLTWEVLEPRGESSNIVNGGSNALTLKVLLESATGISRGLTGAFIYDGNSRLLAGWSIEGFRLEPGIHEMLFSFPYLPLKPGAYFLHFSIYDDKDLRDYWQAVPSLVIHDIPVTHFMDEWAGFLNIPCKLEIGRP